MVKKSCFIFMAPGVQDFYGQHMQLGEPRNRFDGIAEAIIGANPDWEVLGADDLNRFGSITDDIILRIMESDYVVADITSPNYNVFYALGLRHACRVGTAVIKERSTNVIPLNIAHLRYFEYNNTWAGLQELAKKLKQYFETADKVRDLPDNVFLQKARAIKYRFPNYDSKSNLTVETEILTAFIQSPELCNILSKLQNGEAIEEHSLIEAFFNNPELATPFLEALINSGEISFSNRTHPITGVERSLDR